MANSEKRMANSEKRMANSEIKKVGIIGEGKMGTNLFYYLLDFGFDLVWVCSRDSEIDKIHRTFEKKLKRSLDAGLIGHETYSLMKERTVITDDLKHLDQCDMLIEAITEDLEAKRDLFRTLSTIVSASCILASNSSSMIPSRLSGDPSVRNNLVGLHFFYPVPLKNIAELITTDSTSWEVISVVKQFLRHIRRDHLLLHEKDAFVLNRIFLDLQNEAYLLTLEEKMDFQQVDAIIRKYLFPIGTFELCDSVGLDIMRTSVGNYLELTTGSQHYQLFHKCLAEMAGKNQPGSKPGAGFYDRSAGQPLDEDVLNGVPRHLAEKVTCRLTDAMKSSIARFSRQSGIGTDELTMAMSEYLGSEVRI